MGSRLAEYTMFTFWSFVYALTLRADVFFVSSTPPLLGLPVGMAARLRRIPVVYNLQDLFPESAVQAGLINRGPVYLLLRFLEKLCYNLVDEVVAISPDFKDHVHKLSPRVPVTVIPNWADTETSTYVPRERNRFLKLVGNSWQFLVLYAGNVGLLQGLDTVLEAASLVRHSNPTIHFTIVGDGVHKPKLIDRAEKLGLANVTFLPFQPDDWVPDVYSAADVCLVPLRGGAGLVSVPGKTWTIMACGRPIIACTDPESELARVIRLSGAGTVVPPDDPYALAQAVLAAFENRETVRTWGERGRKYVAEHLGRQRATAAYAEVLKRLSTRGQRFAQR